MDWGAINHPIPPFLHLRIRIITQEWTQLDWIDDDAATAVGWSPVAVATAPSFHSNDSRLRRLLGYRNNRASKIRARFTFLIHGRPLKQEHRANILCGVHLTDEERQNKSRAVQINNIFLNMKISESDRKPTDLNHTLNDHRVHRGQKLNSDPHSALPLTFNFYQHPFSVPQFFLRLLLLEFKSEAREFKEIRRRLRFAKNTDSRVTAGLDCRVLLDGGAVWCSSVRVITEAAATLFGDKERVDGGGMSDTRTN